MAIVAVPDADDLVQDYTIEPQGSGGGNVVPQSFVIQGTLPVRINGGASADMSTSPMTISTNTFGAAVAGIVPLSGGGTSNFLRADGTWASPSGSGGYTTIQEEAVDLTQRGKLNFAGADIAATDDAGNSRTNVTLNRFGAATGGTVAPSGGGTSNYLRADGSWAAPGVPGGITLQGSTPGSADVGHGNITGTFIAGKLGLGVTSLDAFLHVASDGSTSDAIIGSHGSSSSILTLRRSNGTPSAPTATADGDGLGGLNVSNRTSSASYASGSLLRTIADGAVHGSLPHQRFMDIINGSGVSFSLLRQSIEGIRVSKAHSSFPANNVRAKSTFEVAGSFGGLAQTKTSSFTVDDETMLYRMDISGATVRATLPTAVGREGRMIGFTLITNVLAAGTASIRANGAELINGYQDLYLPSYGDTVWLQSDNANWWIVNNGIGEWQGATRADHAAVGASSTSEVVAESMTLYNITSPGTIFGIKARGTYSTSGTPLMSFHIKETGTGGTSMLPFASMNGASGASDYTWEIDAAWRVETVAGGSVTVARLLTSMLSRADGNTDMLVKGATALGPAASFSASGVLVLVLTHTFGSSNPSNNVRVRSLAGWVKPGTRYAF